MAMSEAKMGGIPLLIDVVNDTERVAPAASLLGSHGTENSVGFP